MPHVKNVSAWNKGQIEWKHCLICQKPCRKWQKYCSQECYQKSRPKPTFLNKTCVNCKIFFQARLSHRNYDNCSDKCAKITSGKSKSGEKHPLWGNHLSEKHKEILAQTNKGKRPWNYKGITSQNKLERTRFRKEIQKLVFERDNYTCQLCLQHGGILHVDHIQSWAEYVELRFNMKNLRTLCVKCHYKITFGKPMPKESKWGIIFKKEGTTYVR